MRKMLYLTDCEGPISKNDNAFELAEHFVPEGGKLAIVGKLAISEGNPQPVEVSSAMDSGYGG